MASVGLYLPSQQRAAGIKQSTARRDVLVVCSNRMLREEFAEIFERRQLQTVAAANCRSAERAVSDGDLGMVIIIPDARDSRTTSLISQLWAHCPNATVWLIGNPYALRLTEAVMNHQVAVLPSETSVDTFERIAFASEVFSSACRSPARPPDTPFEPELNHAQKYYRAKARFEKRFLTKALQHYDGNVTLTAKKIGVARRNLQSKIRSLAIDIEGTRGRDPENAAME